MSLIETRIEDAILFVTLNRPEKRNALTFEMTHQIAEAVKDADNHPEVRAVIISGEGPMFSAGVDLNGLAQSGAAMDGRNIGRALRRTADQLQYDMHTIESTEVPIIGAVHGRVIGMGLELALAFDLLVSGESCTFSIPESRMGLVADVGGTTRLARAVGPRRAKDMLLTARSIDAREALGWGLVNRVVPDADVMNEAIALARQISRNAPLALGMAKLIVDQGDGLDKQSQMALERWAQGQLIGTEDFMEAVGSFLEKREPSFKSK